MKILSILLVLIVGLSVSGSVNAQEQTPVDLSIRSTLGPSLLIPPFTEVLAFNTYIYIEGKRGATGVVYTVEIPEDVTFLSVNSDGGTGGACNYADNRVTCNFTFPPLKDGVRLIDYNTLIQINLKPTKTGTITLTGLIKANEPDPNLSNNTTTNTYTVVKSRKRIRFF